MQYDIELAPIDANGVIDIMEVYDELTKHIYNENEVVVTTFFNEVLAVDIRFANANAVAALRHAGMVGGTARDRFNAVTVCAKQFGIPELYEYEDFGYDEPDFQYTRLHRV